MTTVDIMTINFVYCVVVLVQIISISTIVCQSQDEEDIPSNSKFSNKFCFMISIQYPTPTPRKTKGLEI